MTDAAHAAPAAQLLDRLAGRGWTIGVAESLTGGLVIATLVAVPGASNTVRGGVIAYATDLKRSLLHVDAALLSAEGPVHPDVAAQMAEGVRAATGSDVGVATTGVAGPEPQAGRPVGTVYVAVATPEGTRVGALSLDGTRSQIRAAAVDAAVELALSSV